MDERRRRIGARGSVRAPAGGRRGGRVWPSAASSPRAGSPSRSRRSRPGCRPSWSSSASWVGEEYCSTPARGLGLVLPPGIGTGAEARRVRPLVELEVEATEEGLAAVSGGERLGLRQRAVLRALAAGPKLARTLAATAGSDRATLRRLETRGLVRTPRGRAPTAACGSRGGRGRRRRPAAPPISNRAGRDRLVPRSAARRGQPAIPAPRRDGLGQDRGLPRGGAGGARSGGGGRSCSSRRSR